MRNKIIHLHNEQFDGAAHPWCGRGHDAVTEVLFEVTPPAQRCSLCDREWFPNGQPDWHYRASVRAAAELGKGGAT